MLTRFVLLAFVALLTGCPSSGAPDTSDKTAKEANKRPPTKPKPTPKPKPIVLPEGFVRIEPGTFTMGSPQNEPERNDDELQHQVTISRPFALQAVEVTQAQWSKAMGNAPSHFSKCGPTCPVESVNRFEAMAYANALSKAEGVEACYQLKGCSGSPGTGCAPGEQQCAGDFVCASVSFVGLACMGYRLPTEAEWEFAARAGTETANFSGAFNIVGARNAPALDGFAWYGGNSGATYEGAQPCDDWEERQIDAPTCGPHPTGEKTANPWGLFDIQGNVWEWVQDDYAGYPTGSVTDPVVGGQPSAGIVRGGSWAGGARHIRAAHRFGGTPNYRFHQVGFRVARTLE